MTRILLVDDHDAVRKGLQVMLNSHKDWEVCGEAANGRDAVKLATQLKPDVAGSIANLAATMLVINW